MRCTDLSKLIYKKQKCPEEDRSVWGRKRNMILPMGPRAVRYMGLNTWSVRHATMLTLQYTPGQKELKACSIILDNLTPNVARFAFLLGPSLSAGGDALRRLPLPIRVHNPVGRAVWLQQIYSGGNGTASVVGNAIKCSGTIAVI